MTSHTAIYTDEVAATPSLLTLSSPAPMELLLTDEDQSQAVQPNSLAEGPLKLISFSKSQWTTSLSP